MNIIKRVEELASRNMGRAVAAKEIGEFAKKTFNSKDVSEPKFINPKDHNDVLFYLFYPNSVSLEINGRVVPYKERDGRISGYSQTLFNKKLESPLFAWEFRCLLEDIEKNADKIGLEPVYLKAYEWQKDPVLCPRVVVP